MIRPRRPGLTPHEAALLDLCARVEALEARCAAQLALIKRHELRIEELEWAKRLRAKGRAA
jgi:hypothetical protein